MYCTVCRDMISTARLEAMPGATMCIECASADDVLPIKRFDDYKADGEVSECYFTKNSMIDSEIERLRFFNHNVHIIPKPGYYEKDSNRECCDLSEMFYVPFHYMEPTSCPPSSYEDQRFNRIKAEGN